MGILREINWSFKTADEYQKYLTLLDVSLNSYEEFSELHKEACQMDMVEVGRIIPDFKIMDSDNRVVALSDYYQKSEYLLLDFWSSSCSSCRKESRNIKKAYDRFNKKGFDVFGVSTDTNKDLWLKAVAVDNLPWTNTSNLKSWSDNDLVKIFALRQVSANFLVDGSGKILAKDLTGDDLLKKLNELLGSE